MANSWYPENKQELESVLDKYLKKPKLEKEPKKINGLIVPHAGYEYSGQVAGAGFSLLKTKSREDTSKPKKILGNFLGPENLGGFLGKPKGVLDKAIIIGPSHYVYLNNAITSNREFWETPLGKIRLFNTDFIAGDISQEHSITNQVPFLQKLNFKEIMPLMAGKISLEQASEIAEKLSKIQAIYIFSTDLSHFLPYEQAVKKDKQTIEIIENIDFNIIDKLDACGIYPLLVLFNLCKIKKTKPKLIQYKNSGDITGDKSGVVGYSSFYF